MVKKSSRFLEKLRGHTTERELLYALRSIEVLLSSGIGLESAMKHVADGSYGEISIEFQKILDEINNGEYIESSLRRAITRTKSRGLRKALITMVNAVEGDISLVEPFGKIAEKETKVRKVILEGYIDKLSTTTEIFMVVGILIPIIMGGVILADSMMNIFGDGQSMLHPTLVGMILGVTLGILLFLVIQTKLHEPQV